MTDNQPGGASPANGNVVPFLQPPKKAKAVPWSFDILQPEANGMVLIDACVPLEIAAELFEMLQTRYPRSAD